jgi:hypothetical protein
MQANADPATNDTITVPDRTFKLTLVNPSSGPDTQDFGDLDITGPVTINGAGARLTKIDGNGIDRVFDVAGAATAEHQISGVTITGGDKPSAPIGTPGAGGGGILNGATLTLSDSAIVDQSSRSFDGVGIYNTGSLTLNRVLVSRNGSISSRGGGIYNSGIATIVNTTVTGNTAGNGGGIYQSGSTSSLSIEYSTITANLADSAPAIRWDDMSASRQIRDSIVALNDVGPQQCIGTPSSGGHNIESGMDCGFIHAANGDRQNTDPKIGPLADNGGPTNSHLPDPTGPAIDAAANAGCPPVDQRGFARPFGVACDIGAVEYPQGGPPPPLPPQPPPPLQQAPPRPATLTLDPLAADRRPGDANTVTATVRNTDGSVAANESVVYSIAGANPGAGIQTTDASGQARISWKGVLTGTDTLTAFVDVNRNGVADAEPSAIAAVTWSLPAPEQGRSFNIEPVSGVARITLPLTGRRRGAHSADASVQLLTEGRQVPIGTVVDVRRGRVAMTTAADKSGDIQKGEFYGGVYQTAQSASSARPYTDLRLTEPLACQPNRRGRLVPARARSRRLWGSGKGRFRTRGRNSTATVRGTVWLQKDTCTTTTTIVREGTVIVRDFGKRKNVRVTAGHRYVARARGR